jgi:hypothetical protein
MKMVMSSAMIKVAPPGSVPFYRYLAKCRAKKVYGGLGFNFREN